MSADGKRNAVLAARPPGGDGVIDDVQLQKLWLATQLRQWRSLAILSAGDGLSTIEFANVLSKIAWFYSGRPTCVFDLRDLSLRLVEHQLQEIGVEVDAGNLVFVALRGIDENPTARLIARASDAAILCVALGRTKVAAAKRVIDDVGHKQFLGTVMLRAPNGTATPPPAAR
jgi:hypothetical protein